MNGNSYDLIFSLGEACSCTQALRASKLQIASYPFDWLYGSDFVGRCKILANKFERFIEKEDLKRAHEERNINCIAYHNKFNDITFNHDFPKDIDFDIAYEKVKEKYTRRILRLLSCIEKAKDVLIVYVESPTTGHINVDNKTIIEGFEILKERFGNKVNLLYIKNLKNKYILEKLDANILIITCDYKDYESEFDYSVKNNVLSDILKSVKLKYNLSYRLKSRLIKIFVNFILNKDKRKILRDKYV